MIEKQIQIVCDYWNKKERGRAMIKSNSVSDSDLLFLIPNNKKKILGLPLTRLGKKCKKREYKKRRTRHINNFGLFDCLAQVLEDRFGDFFQKEFVTNFVNVKDVENSNSI